MSARDDAIVEELAEAICRVMELQFPEYTRLKWQDQSLPAKSMYRRRARAAIDVAGDKSEAATTFKAWIGA